MTATDAAGTAAPRGRDGELTALKEALAKTRGGHGTALVIQGESGLGKTTLTEALRLAATGFLILETTGVESEAEIPLAGLHRLLQPLADRVRTLPYGHAQILLPVLT